MNSILKTTLVGVVIGLLLWTLDAWLDFFVAADNSFWYFFSSTASTHTLFMRMVILVSFALFGAVVGFLREQQKVAAQQMQVREQQYRWLMQHAADAIFVADADGNYIEVNERACQMLGYTREELLQLNIVDLLPPAEIKRRPVQYEALRAGKTILQERKLIHKDGHLVEAEISSRMLPNGQLEGIVRDVTERNKAERALRKSEARFRSVFEGANLGMSIVDRQNRLLAVNPALAELLGYRVDELLGMSFVDFTHPDDVLEDVEATERLRRGEVDHVQLEKRYVRKDGRIIWVMLRVVRLPGAAKGSEETIGMVIDISEQRAAEAALRKALRAYRVLSDCNQALVRADDELQLMREICTIIADKGGFPLVWVGAVQQDEAGTVRPIASAGAETDYLQGVRVSWRENAYGMGPAGTAVRERQTVVIPDLKTDRTFAPWRETAVRHDFKTVIALPIFVDGDVVAVLAIYADEPDTFDMTEVPLLEELAGDLSFGLQMLRREAQRRQMEQALRESEARFRSFFNNAALPVAIMDLDGKVVETNEANSSFLGYEYKDLIGMSFADFTHPDDLDSDRALYASLVQGAQHSYITDKRFIRQDEAIVWGRLAVSLIRDENDVPQYTTVVCQDITLRKEMEDELRKLNVQLEQRVAQRTAELEAANVQLLQLAQIKDDFVANVSHELRTPITTIKLYNDLLTRRPDRQEQYVQRMAREIDRLTTLVEDLLTLSRLDQDRMEPEKTAVLLNDLVRSLVEDRRPVAAAVGVALHFRSTELPECHIDPAQIMQVVSILLTNAITYTPAGGEITVTTLLGATDNAPQIGVRVTDTGPGIPPEEQEHIFERFYRGTAGRESGAPGTGLGLAIANAIMAQHQGKIVVDNDSTAGQGASFTIWLPLAVNG